MVHHTSSSNELVADGRLTPRRAASTSEIAYHDPCYLGRYNDIYDAPRAVLRAIPGVELAEMRAGTASGPCAAAREAGAR